MNNESLISKYIVWVISKTLKALFFVFFIAISWSSQAWADPNCNAISTTTLNFGTVTNSSSTATQITTSFKVTCTFDNADTKAKSAKPGSAGSAATQSLYMCVQFPITRTLTTNLVYKIYEDTNHLIPWGTSNITVNGLGLTSYTNNFGGPGLQFYDSQKSGTTKTYTFTVYGLMDGNQASAQQGTYSVSLTSSALKPLVYYSQNQPCNAYAGKVNTDKSGNSVGPGPNGFAMPGFIFNVQVTTLNASCIIYVNDPKKKEDNVTFRTVLNANNSINQITSSIPLYPLCTNNTPYTIGVRTNNQIGTDVNVERSLKNGNYSIPYNIYTDSNYKIIWVNVGDSHCQNNYNNCIFGTGTGNKDINNPINLYIKIPSFTFQTIANQSPIGSYTDTVIITIQY